MIGNRWRTLYMLFQSIHTTASPQPSNSSTQEINADLIKPIAEEEIILAMKSLGPWKAPVPDGLHGAFYLQFWEECKPSLLKFIRNFFNPENPVLPSSISNTNIVLIPKIKNPSSPNHYRPISLCNFSYKIISKIISLRLQPLLPLIISSEQAGFIED